MGRITIKITNTKGNEFLKVYYSNFHSLMLNKMSGIVHRYTLMPQIYFLAAKTFALMYIDTDRIKIQIASHRHTYVHTSKHIPSMCQSCTHILFVHVSSHLCLGEFVFTIDDVESLHAEPLINII